MKIVLSIPIEHYDPFLKKTKPKSREHILLRNGIIEREKKVVEVACELETAKELLEFARMIHPAVVSSIEMSIRTSRTIGK